ncbi:MAG: methionyl-tRNA formyltransferase [Lachnospiraceae bacterium]|nr:methionyl-tRNA formyltransferase [Lachnospiraceae bacterium]MBQ6196889.1 methionyl-tRNA formyltransferase [Lachnospiraceae bacterium]
MKILFMGTPDFSVPVLEALIEAGHEIVLAVTQPDKPIGRSKKPTPPPVKVCAEKHGIPVFQPERVRRPEAMERLAKVQADLGVVVAFGQILPQALLDLPAHGCFNVHASLLPMYRGASPINHVILAGEKQSGVTIMQMDAGIDTGDILLQEALPLADNETAETLADKLSKLGAKLIVSAVEQLENGTLTHTPQEGETCYAGMLKKEMGLIDWTLSAEEICRRVRGLQPWPGSWTFREGKKLIIKEAAAEKQEVPPNLIPGAVLEADRKGLLIQTGEGALRILSLQPEGKKEMDWKAFLNGSHVKEGERWG